MQTLMFLFGACYVIRENRTVGRVFYETFHNNLLYNCMNWTVYASGAIISVTQCSENMKDGYDCKTKTDENRKGQADKFANAVRIEPGKAR